METYRKIKNSIFLFEMGATTLVIVLAVMLALVTVSTASAAPVESETWIVCDPDAFPHGTVLNNAWPGVTLSALGDPGVLPNSDVLALSSSLASTPPHVFGDNEPGSSESWGDGNWDYLRADFAMGAVKVCLDFITNDSGDQNSELLAFNSVGVEIDRDGPYSVPGPAGTYRTLEVSGSNIAYIEAYWDNISRHENGLLDNLRYVPVPEPATVLLVGLGGLSLLRRRRK